KKGNKRPQKSCAFCKGQHWSNNCKKYDTYGKKVEQIRKLHVCFKCLKGQTSRMCHKQQQCFHCKKPHNTAVCRNKQPVINTSVATSPTSTVPQNSGSSNRRTPQAQITVLLCKIIWVANPQDPDKKVEAAVFFDSGCQRSFITEELAEQLISAVRRPIFIATFAEMQSKVYDSREVRVNLVLKSVQNAITACTMQFLAQKLLIAQISDREGQQLKQANLNVIQSAIVCKKPQIVVDLEYYFSFIKGRRTVLNPGFQLIDSAVGWMTAGEGAVNNITMKTKKVLAQTAIIVNTVLDEQPDVDQFWHLEALGLLTPYKIRRKKRQLNSLRRVLQGTIAVVTL
ncbi:unnamed protein product, partial [Gongylonema pulchrum]|uniref:DUF1758 domain-containing protein n=1 Tax=Gongylonema pulchrum TaxID=637853 RepID=A0A183EMB6_9BILA